MLNVIVADAQGSQLAAQALKDTGEVGGSTTFSAAEIQIVAESLSLPEGYTLDPANYSDVTVAYGSTENVTFTASAQTVDPQPEPEPTPDPEPGGETGGEGGSSATAADTQLQASWTMQFQKTDAGYTCQLLSLQVGTMQREVGQRLPALPEKEPVQQTNFHH